MNNQTLQERKEALIKQQKALIKKRDNINQELKEVKKKIEDSEKDYLMEFLKNSKMTIHEAIEKLKSNIDNQNHYQ
ncbi:hypothetical protein BUI56_11755 [Lactococcus lactis subsp. lactis]|uniref:Uncharacterized protein n=1 Tax=Lactococcus lactis subsp. cremoris TaxID=1359 RepID=A0AAJ6MKY8_LACLC|nr:MULTISPECIES: hypothetical protein [Lactococcus]ADZ65044.1 conserved hypothetical protein [Lactococcus lactis subsp. lactis CV56]ARD90182.1 hypothetical protein LL158_04040 [Lactococcus cremoris]KAF0951609.1 hypothetical protein BUI56_11755 [Lactococcus lactis subsp. lactis]MRM68247.1 hypothetical protein [Lactococcus cremoris]QEX50318.1 ORF53 [Lactococcus lactis subsp. lactis bv. diacetylactis]